MKVFLQETVQLQDLKYDQKLDSAKRTVLVKCMNLICKTKTSDRLMAIFIPNADLP